MMLLVAIKLVYNGYIAIPPGTGEICRSQWIATCKAWAIEGRWSENGPGGVRPDVGAGDLRSPVGRLV